MLDPKLETLIAVEEEKNITKAAARLALTQPAVSHQIRLLEKELGAELFVRRKGETVPTEKGEIAVTYARRFAAMYKKMLGEIASVEKHMRKIRIGITHTAESNIVTEILGRFSAKNGNVSLTVITDNIKNLYTMIKNYELDFAIVEGKVYDPDLSALMLDTDHLVCVTAPTHPLAGKTVITLKELKKQKMILRLPASATRMLFESTLESIGESADDFNVILEVDSIAAIKDLVRKELGVSILPQSTCRNELRRGKLAVLPIENLSMVRETNIVYSRNFMNTDILEDMVQTYREAMKKL